jgi:Na+-driven multidrug efflux pump
MMVGIVGMVIFNLVDTYFVGQLGPEELAAMGAEGKVLDFVKKYMFIWYLGVACVVIPMVGNNAIRAAGNTLIPSIIMLIAIVVNLVLDPINPSSADVLFSYINAGICPVT